jgi:hypothetical protein
MVKPEHCDSSGLHTEAFVDNYPNLSFSLDRVKSPAEVLAVFANRGPVRKRCGTGRNGAAPTEMYDAGYRVAAIRVQVILDAQFGFKIDDDGNQFNEEGHVDVLNGQEHAATWAARATVLPRDETIG